MTSLVLALHGEWLAWAAIGIWPIIGGWSLALRVLGYRDAPTFWRSVVVGHVLLGLQILLGLVLLVLHTLGLAGLPGDGSLFDFTWHLLYGMAFPLIVLIVGHRLAARGVRHPHTVFAVVGLVNFGLMARAWQVGMPGF